MSVTQKVLQAGPVPADRQRSRGALSSVQRHLEGRTKKGGFVEEWRPAEG